MLGLAQPGGPAIEQAARHGDTDRYRLPRPLKGRAGCDFSFSGLKTAVRHLVAGLDGPAPTDRQRADIAAAFQMAVGDVMADRCRNAIEMATTMGYGGLPLVVAGGVAANAYLRERLEMLVVQTDAARLIVPPPALCTDNGAMVAWAGIENLRAGWSHGLDFEPRPRWPLADITTSEAA